MHFDLQLIVSQKFVEMRAAHSSEIQAPLQLNPANTVRRRLDEFFGGVVVIPRSKWQVDTDIYCQKSELCSAIISNHFRHLAIVDLAGYPDLTFNLSQNRSIAVAKISLLDNLWSWALNMWEPQHVAYERVTKK